jgi:hypothetical protein
MSEKKYTKQIDVESCIICERAEDKHMIMTMSTKVGSFEFVFTPDRWQRLGESAGWFEQRIDVEEIEEETSK